MTYVFGYTPLKKKTYAAQWIGALAGSVPPLIGWSIARGTLDSRAFVLFMILFVWQFPHILAIGWVYREDYRKGGFRALASNDPEGRKTVTQMVVGSVALALVSFAPVMTGLSGPLYFGGMLIVGTLFVMMSAFLRPAKLDMQARRFMLTSVVYLSLLIFFMILDHLT